MGIFLSHKFNLKNKMIKNKKRFKNFIFNKKL